nr:DUF3783 domain-containing protein [uncultured Dubosiella sp.]
MVVVYYGNHFAQRDKIAAVLDQLQVSYIEIGEDSLEQTMEQILNSQGSEPAQSDQEIFLYFSDMDIEEITKIDQALKEAGIHVLHKAVKTETNISWKLGDLLEHIRAEASYFKKREKLRSLVSDPDPVLISTNPKYMNLMVMCYELLEETGVPEKMYDKAIELIETFPKSDA